MHRIHLVTGVTVKVADHEALKLQATEPGSIQFVEGKESVNDLSPQTVRINPKHIALMEKL